MAHATLSSVGSSARTSAAAAGLMPTAILYKGDTPLARLEDHCQDALDSAVDVQRQALFRSPAFVRFFNELKLAKGLGYAEPEDFDYSFRKNTRTSEGGRFIVMLSLRDSVGEIEAKFVDETGRTKALLDEVNAIYKHHQDGHRVRRSERPIPEPMGVEEEEHVHDEPAAAIRPPLRDRRVVPLEPHLDVEDIERLRSRALDRHAGESAVDDHSTLPAITLVRQLREQVSDLSAQLEEAYAAFRNANQNLTQARTDLAAQEEYIQNLEQRLGIAQAQLREVSNKIVLAEQERDIAQRALEANAAEFAGQNVALSRGLEQLAREREAYEADFAKFTSLVANLKQTESHLKLQEAALAQMISKLAAERADIDAQRRALSDALASGTRLHNRGQEVLDALGQARDKMKQMQLQLVTLEGEKQAAEDAALDTRQALERVQEQYAKANAALQPLINALGERFGLPAQLGLSPNGARGAIGAQSASPTQVLDHALHQIEREDAARRRIAEALELNVDTPSEGIAAALSGRLETLAALEAQLQQKEAAVRDLRQQLEEQTTKNRGLKEQLTTIEGQLDQAQARVAEMQTKNDERNRRETEMAERLQQAEADLTRVRKQHGKANAVLEPLIEQLAKQSGFPQAGVPVDGALGDLASQPIPPAQVLGHVIQQLNQYQENDRLLAAIGRQLEMENPEKQAADAIVEALGTKLEALEQLKTQLSEKTAEATTAQTRAQETAAALERAMQDVASARATVEQQQRQLQESGGRITALDQRAGDAENHARDLGQKLERAEQALANLRGEAARQLNLVAVGAADRAPVEIRDEEITAKLRELAGQAAQLPDMRTKLEGLNAQLTEAREVCSKQQQALETAKAEAETAKQKKAALEGMIEKHLTTREAALAEREAALADAQRQKEASVAKAAERAEADRAKGSQIDDLSSQLEASRKRVTELEEQIRVLLARLERIAQVLKIEDFMGPAMLDLSARLEETELGKKLQELSEKANLADKYQRVIEEMKREIAELKNQLETANAAAGKARSEAAAEMDRLKQGHQEALNAIAAPLGVAAEPGAIIAALTRASQLNEKSIQAAQEQGQALADARSAEQRAKHEVEKLAEALNRAAELLGIQPANGEAPNVQQVIQAIEALQGLAGAQGAAARAFNGAADLLGIAGAPLGKVVETLDSRMQELNESSEQLARERRTIEEQRRELEQQRSQLNNMQTELGEQRKVLSLQEQQIESARAQGQAAASSAAEAHAALEALRGDQASAEASHQATIAAKNAEIEALQAQAIPLRTQVDELTAAQRAAQALVEALQAQVGQSGEQGQKAAEAVRQAEEQAEKANRERNAAIQALQEMVSEVSGTAGGNGPASGASSVSGRPLNDDEFGALLRAAKTTRQAIEAFKQEISRQKERAHTAQTQAALNSDNRQASVDLNKKVGEQAELIGRLRSDNETLQKEAAEKLKDATAALHKQVTDLQEQIRKLKDPTEEQRRRSIGTSLKATATTWGINLPTLMQLAQAQFIPTLDQLLHAADALQQGLARRAGAVQKAEQQQAQLEALQKQLEQERTAQQQAAEQVKQLTEAHGQLQTAVAEAVTLAQGLQTENTALTQQLEQLRAEHERLGKAHQEHLHESEGDSQEQTDALAIKDATILKLTGDIVQLGREITALQQQGASQLPAADDNDDDSSADAPASRSDSSTSPGRGSAANGSQSVSPLLTPGVAPSGISNGLHGSTNIATSLKGTDLQAVRAALNNGVPPLNLTLAQQGQAAAAPLSTKGAAPQHRPNAPQNNDFFGFPGGEPAGLGLVGNVSGSSSPVNRTLDFSEAGAPTRSPRDYDNGGLESKYPRADVERRGSRSPLLSPDSSRLPGALPVAHEEATEQVTPTNLTPRSDTSETPSEAQLAAAEAEMDAAILNEPDLLEDNQPAAQVGGQAGAANGQPVVATAPKKATPSASDVDAILAALGSVSAEIGAFNIAIGQIDDTTAKLIDTAISKYPGIQQSLRASHVLTRFTPQPGQSGSIDLVTKNTLKPCELSLVSGKVIEGNLKKKAGTSPDILRVKYPLEGGGSQTIYIMDRDAFCRQGTSTKLLKLEKPKADSVQAKVFKELQGTTGLLSKLKKRLMTETIGHKAWPFMFEQIATKASQLQAFGKLTDQEQAKENIVKTVTDKLYTFAHACPNLARDILAAEILIHMYEDALREQAAKEQMSEELNTFKETYFKAAESAQRIERLRLLIADLKPRIHALTKFAYLT